MKFSNGNKKSSTYTQHDTDGNICMNLLFVLWTRDGVFSLWGTALWGRAADTEQLGLVRSTLGWNHCCTFSWGLQSGPSASGWARPSAAAAGWPWAWCQSPFWQRSDWSVAPPGPWWSCGGGKHDHSETTQTSSDEIEGVGSGHWFNRGRFPSLLYLHVWLLIRKRKES